MPQSRSWQWRSVQRGNASCPRTRANLSIVISEGTCDVMEIYLADEANNRRLRDESPEISTLPVMIVVLEEIVSALLRQRSRVQTHDGPRNIPSRRSPTPLRHKPKSALQPTQALLKVSNELKRHHYNKMSFPDVLVRSRQPLPPSSAPGPFRHKSCLQLLSASRPINSSMPSTPCPSPPSSPCELPSACDRSCPTP